MAIQPNRKLLTSAAAFLLFAAALVFLLRDNHDYHHDHHEEQSAPITAAAADSRLSDGQPSLLQCDHSDSRLRQRHFLPPAQQHKAPALLWSQPGSGNTMTRLLIEYATGYLTGSPYGDKSLLDVLPGEDTCDSSVIAVKLHPLINPRRTNKEDHYTATFKREHGVCDGVSVFARAIILVRNPLDAIWADYQRFISEDHTHSVQAGDLNTAEFRKRAVFTARKWSSAYAQHVRFMREHRHDTGSFVLVKFEGLRHKDTGVPLLRKLTAFLDVPVNEARIACAHDFAETAAVKRHRDLSAVDALIRANALCSVLKLVAHGMQELGYALPPEASRCRKG